MKENSCGKKNGGLVSLKMNLSFPFAIVYLATVFSNATHAGPRLKDGVTCFSNKSTNKVFEVSVIYGEKGARFSVTQLDPGHKSSVYDASMFPMTLPPYFQIKWKDSLGVEHNDRLNFDSALAPKKAKDGSIYFVFTPEQKFVLKIYLDTQGESMRLDGMLLPDENNPAFKSYKELVRAAIDGKAQMVQELLDNGTPYAWPNEPIALTPLGWSVRWNRQEAFDILIKQLPKDFFPYDYYWCIRMAGQDGQTNILKRLLQSDLAKEIPEKQQRDIFYSACNHAKANLKKTNAAQVVEILLEHFKVGIDYKIHDYGHTLLFVAVDADDVELVKWLLEHGANPNAKLQNGNTPLKRSRSAAVTKLLQDHGGQ